MTSQTKRIQLLCPAPPGSRTGNRVTALRWAGHLRNLGHQVEIVHNLKDKNIGRKACVLIAMHATIMLVAFFWVGTWNWFYIDV